MCLMLLAKWNIIFKIREHRWLDSKCLAIVLNPNSDINILFEM